MKGGRSAIMLAVSLFALEGCMLERLLTTQQQLCHGQVRLEKPGATFVFDIPTLLDQDIVTLAGVQPTTTREDAASQLTLSYVGHPKGNIGMGTHALPVTFDFIKEGDKNPYKLKRAHIARHLSELLSEDLLNTVLASGCTAKLHGLALDVDLNRVSAAQLPRRAAITHILGDPQRVNGRAVTYDYVVNSSVNAEIAITYDATLDRMATVHIDYFRYALHVDFAKRLARGGLRGWRDGLALSYWLAVSK